MRRTAACLAAVGLLLPAVALANRIDGTDAPEALRGTPSADTINGKGSSDLGD